MKIFIKFFIFIGLFLLLTGCDLVNKVKTQVDAYSNKYDEYLHPDTRGEKPYTINYQKDPGKKTKIISAQCIDNKSMQYIYYNTPQDAHQSYNNDIKNLTSNTAQHLLIPFWDIRYVNPVTKYINEVTYNQYADHSKYTGLDVRSCNKNIGIGTSTSQTNSIWSIAQFKCINGTIAGGTTINLNDGPDQSLNYGGPHTSFKYSLKGNTKPWKANKTGNLMIQASFNTTLYISHTENIGGGVSFGLFLYNKHNGKHLNYVIGIFAAGEAWTKEKAGIRYDPTTNVVHVATVIKESSWWSTISNSSSHSIAEIYNTSDKDTRKTKNWNNFYRVNIHYYNLLMVLEELKNHPPASVAGQDFGLSPEDWELSSIMIQYELDEIGGAAVLSGSFKGFEAYLSQSPL